MVSAGRAVAGFDSASAMVRVLGSALHRRGAPLLAPFPARLEPTMDWLMSQVERLPKPAVQEFYRRSGWLDARRRNGGLRHRWLRTWPPSPRSER